MAGGRPTLYDETLPDEGRVFLAQGKSIVQLCAKWGVSKQTISRWEQEKPEFSDALKQGRLESQAFWENELVDKMIYSKDVNAPMTKLYFANRFGWHDKQEVKQEVKQTKELSDFYGDT
jgi:hypothetical protein|tara:strand:- start:794 stop:1150 length:357 start_codon:yes stop_codon:yes gene_type:complete